MFPARITLPLLSLFGVCLLARNAIRHSFPECRDGPLAAVVTRLRLFNNRVVVGLLVMDTALCAGRGLSLIHI